MQHILELLARHGIHDIIVTLHYLAEEIDLGRRPVVVKLSGCGLQEASQVGRSVEDHARPGIELGEVGPVDHLDVGGNPRPRGDDDVGDTVSVRVDRRSGGVGRIGKEATIVECGDDSGGESLLHRCPRCAAISGS